jgi:hypothetical protein
MLTEKYLPSVGERDWSIFDPRTTMMLILYAYFYSLIEDSSDGLNGFRIWREQFPEEEQAIAAVEAVIKRFKDELRLFRNRLGFHGSRSREHESRGFELFAKSSGTETFELGFRVHQFMIPGVDFAMFVGARMPQGYEMFCTARSPEGFVLVSKEIDTRVVEYMVNAIRECRQHYAYFKITCRPPVPS